MLFINEPAILDLTMWTPGYRPGFFGARRAQIEGKLDEKVGSDNWTLAWKVGDQFLTYPAAVQFYEDAYVCDLGRRSDLLDFVCSHCDVYDNAVTNVECGLDYLHEENRRARSNHIQDIAIRRAVLRLGRRFNPAGELLEVRGRKSKGASMSPGVVPFHRPDLIPQPEMKPDWAQPGSVEAFWQSAKHVMILAEVLKSQESHPGS